MPILKHGDDLSRGADLLWRAEALARRRSATLARELKNMPPDSMRRTVHDLRVHQIELELQNDELRRVQDKLEQARARYFDLYDLAPVGYLILALDGQILESNRSAAEQLGEAQATLVKQPISRFIHDLDQDIYYLQRKQFLRTGEPFACELRLRRCDGTAFWASMAVVAAGEPAAGGTPVYRMVVSDITERKQAEALLARERSLLRLTQKLGSVGTWAWDPRDRTVSWSEETYRLLDCQPSGPVAGPEPFGRSLDCYLPSDRPVIQAAFQRCAEEGVPYDLEFRITSAKGRSFWIRARGEAEWEDGKVVRVIGIFVEIPGRP
jgi:PAS domain S-box-containing protein